MPEKELEKVIAQLQARRRGFLQGGIQRQFFQHFCMK
jgi:hypothetical protein